jgi:hypothetical protein
MSENLESTIDPLESNDLDLKRSELRKIIHLYSNNIESFEFVSDIAIGFKRDHPDCYDYVLYHDLIGSTPPPWVQKFDMPNNEIEHLIIDLPKLYIDRKKLAA